MISLVLAFLYIENSSKNQILFELKMEFAILNVLENQNKEL